jgi:hypothetical protein
VADTQIASKTSSSRQQSQLREHNPAEIGHDLIEYLREYARDNPETTALWCFGIGFILGWKLKPW